VRARQHLRTDGGEHGFIAPCRGGDEVVERLVQAGYLGRIARRRHRLDALALARQQQAQ